MPTTRFICLANSFKEGGRCLAGIEVDSNNNPIAVNGRPKWIRPVCDTPHGEVPNQVAERFRILDVVEFEILENKPQGYQSENVTFNSNSIKSIGNFNRNQLVQLCDNRNYVFGNKGKAISEEFIGGLNYSLLLISVKEFNVIQKVYGEFERPQIRLSFNFNNIPYEFPVTDPVFLSKYKNNHDILKEIQQLYLCLSLGIVWEGWHYKLVAGII